MRPAAGQLLARSWPALVLLGVVALFGGFAFRKCCLMDRPQGDFRVFCRAGWAARHAPEQLYTVMDHNGWHYHYPPAFALVLIPLAEAPAGAPSSQSALPYPVAFLTFYLVSVAAVAGSVWLLVAVGESRFGQPKTRALWWRWRLVPTLACVVPIGLGISRGQVQALLLLLLAGVITALYHGRRWLAGLLLSAACFKVFPAYLAILPLVRRDWRCLGGLAGGLVLWGALVPAAYFGPETTARLTREWAEEVILPGVGIGQGGASRQAELLASGATHAQSFQVVWHKTLHVGQQCPPSAGAPLKLAHLLVAIGLTAVVLARGRDEMTQACALVLVMVLISPTGHVHYLTLALPLLVVVFLREETAPADHRQGVKWLFAIFFLANLFAVLPGLELTRALGAPLYAACAVLAAALRPARPRAAPEPIAVCPPLRRAA